jgi:NADH-quinone oxidoreductase subunit J
VSPEKILFWAFALATVISAGGVIVARNAIASAMSLVASFFFLAGIYVLLWASTIAALQVLVYAGAIMVLFLFVIMLLNLQHEFQAMAKLGTRFAAGFVASLFLLAVIRLLLPQPGASAGMGGAVPAGFGSTEQLAERLFTRFLLPFEITSVLLLIAIIGAVVLAKRTLK